MARGFVKGNRNQLLALPPVIDRWIGEDHPARLIWECVARMDLEAFYNKYAREGRPPYDPAMLLAVLLYAYCQGIRSSRRIAAACREQLPFMWLTGMKAPDHCTISRFRQRHEAEMEGVFVEVLKVCREAGLVRLGELFLDGTKVKANASLAANMDARRLRAEIRKILEEAREVDSKEDQLYEPDEDPGKLPKDFQDPKKRLERLEEAKRRLEERNSEEDRDSKNSKKINTTDLDSRIMKTPRGYVQGYNVQAVCTQDQIIVAAEATTEANDVRLLEPMVQEIAKSLDKAGIEGQPRGIVADAGYFRSDLDLESLEKVSGTLYVATQKSRKHRKAAQEHSAPRGRIPKDATVRERMNRRLLTKKGKQIYQKRSCTIEPVFGQIKRMLGPDGFLRRGIHAVQSEWMLLCAAFNLKKLIRHWSPQPAIG